jgi:hypothetical protein
MKAVKIHLFSRSFRTLRGSCEIYPAYFEKRSGVDFGKNLIGPLEDILAACEDMHLEVSAVRARWLLESFIPTLLKTVVGTESEKVFRDGWDGLEQFARELQVRIEDESSLRSYFDLRPEQTALYEAVAPFGEEVGKAFPSAAGDIEEAAKCIALDRGTAGVFHLMRVIELGLRTLGKSLNDSTLDPKTNPTWERILHKCDTQLGLEYKKRCDEWRKDGAFYSEATANLRAVKDAWRNPTLHIERSYDPERALEVFQAVKGFMRHLAGRLSE